MTPRCPKCGSERVIKNGRSDTGHRQRYRCLDCGHRPRHPTASERPAVAFNTDLPASARYVATAAQNATPVHKPFLDALHHYCKATGAKLVVIPFRYKNPTSQWTANNDDHEWWAPEVVPYLYDGRFDINQNLTILADIKVQPTAVSPLTGLEGITAARSAVIGHPKYQLKTVATPQNALPKIMTTTGAVTRDNYTDSKAGKKGEFHHTYGATVIEVDGKIFHMRQINAMRDGSFIDLEWVYSARGVNSAAPAEALIMGDTHVDFADPDVVAATFTDAGSIVKALKPKRLVWHDLLDFYSRSHHHRKDPFLGVAKHRAGLGDVRAEVERACVFVRLHTPTSCQSVVVPSNHNEHLGRWLADADWRSDPENAEFYLETALHMVRSAKMTDSGSEIVDPFAYWAAPRLPGVKFLRRDESYTVKGIELSMHGDQGPNGARGHVKAFSRIGVKSVVGHSHSPAVEEGCYQTGTSSRLKLEYNRSGPSSWLNTHCIVYANGKRTLVNIVKGAWRIPR